jgi:phospholipid/cholesterol/gamma-HCH transport system substrate-binding protein
MTSKTKQLRVGVFVVGAIALVVVVLIVFAGLRWFSPRDKYHVRVDDSVFGLEPGAQVLMNGIRIGTVDGMRVMPDDPRMVDITIAVKRGQPIKADTEALLKFVGITGLKVIDLRGGSPAAATLPPGSVIPTGETMLDEVSRRGKELLDHSDELMKQAQAVLELTKTTMTNVAEVTDPAGEIMVHTKTTAANLARATASLDAMVRENRAAIRGSLDAVNRAASSAAELTADLDGVVRDNQQTLRSTLADVRQASRSFRELARELKQRPSRLLFSKAPKDRKLP